MNNRQQRRVGSIEYCIWALNNSRFTEPETVALRKELEEQHQVITGLVESQRAAKGRTRHNAIEIANLKEPLLKDLRMISRKATLTLAGLPGIREEMRIPRGNMKTADFLDGAARLIKNVRPHLDLLYARGLDRKAVARVEARAAELLEKANAADPVIGLGTQATVLLPGAIQRARDIIDAIDSNIRAMYDKRTDKTMWETAKRIPGRVGRPRQQKKNKRNRTSEGGDAHPATDS